MSLRVGDIVEVKSKEEILETLDADGRLDGLPFMPQMFDYCDKQFKVFKSAHKTCDTVNGTGGRRLKDCVHLELRCDGQAYGGCQAACLLFWNTSWLRAVEAIDTEPTMFHDSKSNGVSICSEDIVRRNVISTTSKSTTEVDPVYACQATLLPSYTEPLPWWDVRQYIKDYKSKNVPLHQLFFGFVYFSFQKLMRMHWRLSKPMIRLYDSFQDLLVGVPYPRKRGKIPLGQSTPRADVDLKPGEWVRVKAYEEILATLDVKNKNRGLFFDAELVPYCGGKYQVKSRVEQFIDEKTGKMIYLKTPAIILEHVWCQSRYSDCRLGCPRSIYSWWREAWLERIN
ncbi:MAG: hypothetical protein ACX936_04890 [Marinobacter sp.]